ncbi:MAG: UTP--glucose-1-phosphate uridylyltransferase [Nitrospinae bacterium]|nr:UTP--glucose-1-phosphate uridylyltransferase [Nitrospinota bacterium]
MPSSGLRQALLKMKLDSGLMDAFIRLYERSVAGCAKISDWDLIKSPDPQSLPSYSSLPVPGSTDIDKALGKFVMCKLNGGLGTGMGCRGPKSSIVVREGKTFLDLIVEQWVEARKDFGKEIPLILMNSFYTHQQTLELIEKYQTDYPIHCFQQNRFPRLQKDSGLPLNEEEAGPEAWYPPGHGDFYQCLDRSGWLDTFLDQGKEIIFVSNADNLGAAPDPKILCHMLDNDIPFLMEMTEKTSADVKGGTLCQDGDRLRLLEFAQVPEEHLDEFASARKFKLFNTNNIWINLVHLKKLLEQGPMDLEVVVNEKEVAGNKSIQLETAIGSALDQFSGAVGLVVERDRFLPVKQTSDLLIVQSDLFTFEKGRPSKNLARQLPGLPEISLGDSFKNLEDCQSRIPEPLSMLELEKLNIEGDVRLGRGLVLKGNVSIKGNRKKITIPPGSILDNVTMGE